MKRMLGFAVLMMAVCLPGYGQQATAAESKPAASAAQELGKDQRFRLAFMVKEVDERGKVLNSREYDTMIGATPHHGEPNASIRTGARIPITVSSSSGEITYIDVGVNFDILSFQVLSTTRVAMDIHADLSSVDPASKGVTVPPVVHQNKWSGNEQIVLGERKIIFSSDDLTSKNKVQVELMVTRVD